MIIGQPNTLEIARESPIGLFLKDENNMEVLLPTRYVPENAQVGDELEVFIYRDSEDRLIATTETPKAMLYEFGYLEVVGATDAGAFLDWGLAKDLFVPKKEQINDMSVGEKHLVYVYLDDLTQRLAASARLNLFVSDRPDNLEKGDQVDLLIWREHELGFQVIVDEEYAGMVYKDQIHQNVEPGSKLKGYVNQIREDGRIDALLQKPGFAHVNDAESAIIDALEKEGFIPLNDKSSPDAIKDRFQMSKKSFKKAIGGLYKQRLISIEKDGIRLV